jgi:hypothetical protein
MTIDFDLRKSRVWEIFTHDDRMQTRLLASQAAEVLNPPTPNYGIEDPPWWAPLPFGRFKLVDRNTGEVIARSRDDEYLGRCAERLDYLHRQRVEMQLAVQEESWSGD